MVSIYKTTKIKKNDVKVQLRVNPQWYSGKYPLQYRLEPKNLGWIRRMFNFWHTIKSITTSDVAIYRENGLMDMLHTAGELSKYKEKFKTMGDIKKYEMERNMK